MAGMTTIYHEPFKNPECPACHHAPIRHEEDGIGSTCIVCLWLHQRDISEGRRPHDVCTVKFAFRLSKHEREQATKAAKSTYPQRTICLICNCEWRAHTGFLCPTGDSTFVPDLDNRKPFLYTDH